VKAGPLAAALLCAVIQAPGRAAAQEFLDRGTFVIVQGGVEIGREEFAIRPTAGRQGQAGVLAVSTTRFRDREVLHALELAADHSPSSLQETESADGRVIRRLSAQISGSRVSVRTASNAGETAREFPVHPPVVVLGDDAFHTFYFVPRAATGAPRTIAVVRPRDERPVSATVTALGLDTLLVGDRPVPAQRYVLRLPDGDERQFWFGVAGDLLKVAVPGRDLVATRTELAGR
jgi:hypothetical protein